MFAYILLPNEQIKKADRDLKKESFSFGSLKSSWNQGNFFGSDGVLSQVSKGLGQLESVQSKMNVLGLSQLLKDGKIFNKSALDELCSLPQMTSVALFLGYMSVAALKEALLNGRVDKNKFITALGKFMQELFLQDQSQNLNKEKTIILDLVISEEKNYTSVTAVRRVEQDQTLSEFIHNEPATLNLVCRFIEGVNYAKDEFEFQMDYLREQKTMVSVVIGEERFDRLVLTQYKPTRSESSNSFEYRLSFGQVQVGSVEITKINITSLEKKLNNTSVKSNPADENQSEKVAQKNNLGNVSDSPISFKAIQNKFF